MPSRNGPPFLAKPRGEQTFAGRSLALASFGRVAQPLEGKMKKSNKSAKMERGETTDGIGEERFKATEEQVNMLVGFLNLVDFSLFLFSTRVSLNSPAFLTKFHLKKQK